MSGPTGGTWQSRWYPRPQAEQIIDPYEDPQAEQLTICRVTGDSGDDCGSMTSSVTSSARDCNRAGRNIWMSPDIHNIPGGNIMTAITQTI